MKLNSKTKIQLYILPLLIAYLIYYFYELYNPKIKNTNINKIKNKIKKFDGNYIDIYSKIENFSKTKEIEILNISRKKNSIKLLVKSTLSKSENLVEFLEHINGFSKIQKIDLNKENKSDYIYELELSFNKYYEKHLKKFILEPIKPNTNFKLIAIIDSYIIINNKILKESDYINEFLVKKIASNYVELEKDNKLIILEFKDEKFK